MSTFRLSMDYLPRETFNQLSRIAILVSREYFQLLNIRKEVISLEYAHITPSISYIARKTGLSKYQVSRANTELESIGIICRRQQRTRQGDWKTNIIKLGGRITAIWKTFQSKKKGSKYAGLQKSANIETFKDSEDNYFKQFCELMKNIGSGGRRPAPA